ncbi:MAG: hypothetical protein J6W06_03470 [Bacteroidales bacterium]|jgi:hypothetical protein|nr:hypothetical protein [Bacteroidales bacterium]
MTEQIQKEKAPNSIPALVMSGIALCISSIGLIYAFYPILCIVSIVFCIASLVLSILGKKKTMQGYDIYNASPESYFGVGMLKAAKIMSLVSFILSIVAIVAAIIMTIVYATVLSNYSF